MGLLMIGVLATGFCQAEELSFTRALELALSNNPALAADAARLNAAEQAAIPAGELPDPSLGVGISNWPIEGDNPFSLRDEGMTMERLVWMQSFPDQDKRRARVNKAAQVIQVVSAETAITRQQIQRETALAWIARYTAERQLELLTELQQENQLLAAALQARLQGGKLMSSDIVAPRQEAAMIEARQDEQQSRRQQAIAQLRRWLPDAADWPLQGEVPDWPIEARHLQAQLHQHPELAVFTSRSALAQAEIAEAEANKESDWKLELAYQRREAFDDMISLQFSFELPWFSASRQDPLIAAARARRQAIDAEQDAAQRQHQAELESDLAEYQRLNKAWQRQQQVLIPLAEEAVELALAAWQSNQTSLMAVITARSARIDAQLMAIQLQGQQQAVASKLHYAYGAVAGD